MSDDGGDLLARVQELERETRARAGHLQTNIDQVTMEIAVERTITRHLVEAVQTRIDLFENRVLAKLAIIIAKLGTNGTGGHNG